MALGNIKVKRTNVIARIESVRDKAQKVLDTVDDRIDSAKATAEEANTAVQEAIVNAVTTATDVQEHRGYRYHGDKSLSVTVEPTRVAHKRFQAAEKARDKANEKVRELTNEKSRAEFSLAEASRDLALLNASEEDTINVKTAGFLGYFE